VILMHFPVVLSGFLNWWASVYSDHRVVSVAIRSVHIGAIVVGGGTAIATDRAVLRAARKGPETRNAALSMLAAAHRTVVPALAAVIATGVLMTAADSSTFLPSPLFWTKVALVLLLLTNGYGLVVAERLAVRGIAWKRLAVGSAVSLTLWIVILIVGTALTAVA
jgi:ABC-type spermidine/putrescine transport system permease subunit II